MLVEAQVSINASNEAIWNRIADIENMANTITGIQLLEVLEKPATGLVGYKWRETRLLFGKSATATMWITEAVENEYYTKRSEEEGCVYICTLRIVPEGGSCKLTMTHETQPQSLMRRLLLPVFAVFLKGIMRKLMRKDLNKIKAAVEKSD